MGSTLGGDRLLNYCPNKYLHALYSRSFIQCRKKAFFVSKGGVESPPLWRPAYTCLTVFLCPPVSLTYLSLLVKGEESVVLCGDLLAQF